MKYSVFHTRPSVDSRSPYGERGLKYSNTCIVGHEVSRSPYGERGLKLERAAQDQTSDGSLSLRRAWIEITGWYRSLRRGWCRSPYGERGLKYWVSLACVVWLGRSPYGERGLKCKHTIGIARTIGRSPYGERGLKSRSCTNWY